MKPGRLARAAPLASLLGLLTFVLHLALRPMEETDLFFRLAVGEQILRSGSLPQRNLFSFTYPDHPDLDSAWLFDAGAALLYRLGGFPAVVLAKGALLALIFALAHRFCRRRGAGPLATLLALAAAAFVMQERLTERPHLFSFLGVLLVGELLARGPRWPWLLVPLTALWANFHAGAFLAPLLVLAAAGGAALDARRAGTPLATSRALPLALLATAALAALLLTPVGPGIFRYLAFHLDINTLHPVDEFRRPTWHSDAPLLLYLMATLVLVLLAAARAAEPASLCLLLPPLLLALLFVRSVRFGAELALLTAPLLALALTRLGGARPALVLPLALGLVAASVVPRALAPRAQPPARFIDVGLDQTALPLGALAFADRHQLRARMYNDFELGAYLIFRDYPRHQVFVDPRLPAYPRSFHTLLGRLDLDAATWDHALAGFGVDTALLGHAGINHRMGWWDPTRWALVYRQDDARIFVRRLPRFAGVIALYEIPATFRFTAATGTETLPLVAPPPGSPVPVCEWQLRLGDLYFDLDDDDTRALAATRAGLAQPGCLPPERAAAAHAWVGAMLLGHGRAAEALAHLDRALALGSTQDPDLVNRALCLEALGRTAEARLAWERVATLTNDPALARRARALTSPPPSPPPPPGTAPATSPPRP